MALALAEVGRPLATKRTEEGVRMGEQLELLRQDRGLTQQQVADRLGMSLQGYLGYRKGYQRVNRNSLPRWAAALDMPTAELAQALGIGLLTDADPSGLRHQLAALLPDASAAELDIYVRDLATLPASDQRQILDGFRDWIAGRKAHLGLA